MLTLTPDQTSAPAPVDAILITFPDDVLVATVSGQRTPDDTLYYAELMTELYGILGGMKS